MAKITYDNSGEHEAIASALTLSIYEREFHKSAIADVYGKFDLTDGGKREVVNADYVLERLTSKLDANKTLPKATVALVHKAFPAYITTEIDYTADNWDAYLRCLWAMLRTSDKVRHIKDPKDAHPDTPDYEEWLALIEGLDMQAVSNFVFTQTQDGWFHSQR